MITFKFLLDKRSLQYLAKVPPETEVIINKTKVAVVEAKCIDEARKKCLAKSVPKTRGAKW